MTILYNFSTISEKTGCRGPLDPTAKPLTREKTIQPATQATSVLGWPVTRLITSFLGLFRKNLGRGRAIG